MNELVGKIPGDVFAAFVVGTAFGVTVAWRFTRALARFRDAVNHARHHWLAALGFARFARENVTAIVTGGATLALALSLVGLAVFLRVSG